MASVSQPASARPGAPVRHGSVSCEVRINGVPYRLRRCSSIGLRGERSWSLTHTSGPRVGTTHVVCRVRKTISCSCEDASMRGARCKHLRALIALGLISGRGEQLAPSVARLVPPAAPSSKGGD
jgi:SWIM zinc finger